MSENFANQQPQPTFVPVPMQVPVQVPVQVGPRTSGFAVTSLVTGIVGLCLCWVPGLDLILAVLAIVFGSIGWWQHAAKERNGFGMAIAGLVCGVLTVVAFILFLVAFH